MVFPILSADKDGPNAIELPEDNSISTEKYTESMLKSDSGGDENQTKTALTWKTKAVLQIFRWKIRLQW